MGIFDLVAFKVNLGSIGVLRSFTVRILFQPNVLQLFLLTFHIKVAFENHLGEFFKCKFKKK